MKAFFGYVAYKIRRNAIDMALSLVSLAGVALLVTFVVWLASLTAGLFLWTITFGVIKDIGVSKGAEFGWIDMATAGFSLLFVMFVYIGMLLHIVDYSRHFHKGYLRFKAGDPDPDAVRFK